MSTSDNHIFYCPFSYLHRVRLNSEIGRILSWWMLLVVPTLGYYLLAISQWQVMDWVSYVLLLAAVVPYYELGYMLNDTFTTQREEHPSLRLSEVQASYFYGNVGHIVGLRLGWVIGILVVYCILNSWSGNSLLTIGGVLLLLPVFCVYNRIRGLKAVIFYPVLVSWRYLVFLLPVWGCAHWWTYAILLLLSYPLEISLERYSMPNKRYGWMARLIPNEESKQGFRAIYYAVLVVLLPLWLQQPLLCLPIVGIGLYRWIRYSPLLCWMILLLPNLYTLYVFGDMQTDWLKGLIFLYTSILCILLPCTILRARPYFIFVGMISLPVMGIELASLFVKHIPTNELLLDIITGTTMTEAIELVSGFIPYIIGICLLGVLFVIGVVWTPNKWLFSRRGKIAITIGSLPILIGILGTEIPCFSRYFIPHFGHPVRIDLTFPYDVYISAVNMHKSRQNIRMGNEQLSSFSFGLSHKDDTIPEHYILVLGESARADHMQLNGYQRETNPYLEKMEHLYSFRNAYAEANLTIYSLPLILTRADALHDTIAYQEKSIVEAFAEAGFETAWLTNNCNIAYAKRVMSTVNYLYQSTSGMEANCLYDSILVDELSKWYEQCGNKTFTVIHLAGSHYKYSYRYPKVFEHFVPAIQNKDGHAVLSPAYAEQLTNSYDNSILYTDYILAQIIHRLQLQTGNTSLLYVSDHGEQLFTEKENTYSHGSALGQRAEYHVPIFLWLGDEYISTHSAYSQILEENQNKFISTQTIFHTLSDLGDLKGLTNTQYSLVSEDLVEQDTIFSHTGSDHIYMITH